MLSNRAYAGLRHAIVITTKSRFVKRTHNTEVRLGGDNNSVMFKWSGRIVFMAGFD